MSEYDAAISEGIAALRSCRDQRNTAVQAKQANSERLAELEGRLSKAQLDHVAERNARDFGGLAPDQRMPAEEYSLLMAEHAACTAASARLCDDVEDAERNEESARLSLVELMAAKLLSDQAEDMNAIRSIIAQLEKPSVRMMARHSVLLKLLGSSDPRTRHSNRYGPIGDFVENVANRWSATPYDTTGHWLAELARPEKAAGLPEEIDRIARSIPLAELPPRSVASTNGGN